MKINIGGVPEHFNIHWHLFFEKCSSQFPEIQFEWKDFSTGTGAMMKEINGGQLDLAITLTEGSIKLIAEGYQAKIVDFYVNSPLTWGVHVPWNSEIAIEEIFEKRFGISRHGSGSHLMPKIHAKNQGKSIEESQFVVVNNLEGALDAFSKGECEVFYWEKFTTMPFVKENGFKCVGYFPTPWPCFVVVCNDQFGNKHKNLINKIINGLQQEISSTAKNSLINPISERYHLLSENVKLWIDDVEWNTSTEFLAEKINMAVEKMAGFGLLENKINTDKLLL